MVDAVRQKPVFLARKLRDLPLLALDIARILHLNLDRLLHRGRKRRALGVKGRKVPVADLRATDQIGKARRSLDACSIVRKQHFVERRAFCNAGRLQPFDLPVNGPVFFQHRLILLVRHQPDPVPDGGKPLVGIVLPV